MLLLQLASTSLRHSSCILASSHSRAISYGISHLQRSLSTYSSNRSGNSSRQHASSAAAFAGAATAAAAALWGVWPAPVSQGDAVVEGSIEPAGVADAEQRAQFAAWIAANGGDMSAAAVQPCQDSESGLGLFATPELRRHMSHRWLGRRLGGMLLSGSSNQTVTVASIPWHLVMTFKSALADVELGSQYAMLVEQGLLDERSAVIVMLLVERAKGGASAYAPWIQLLPTSIDAPLFWDDQQLQHLAGTTLAAATAARKAALNRSWQQLQPAVSQMLRQVGIYVEPTFDDFLWATSIFWSRALALPVTVREHSDEQQQQQQQDSHHTIQQQLKQQSSNGGSRLRIEVLEGLVPGIDFANHSQQAKCWWEVEPFSTAQQQQQQQQQPSAAAAAAAAVRQENASVGDNGPTAAGPAAVAGGDSHVVKLITNRVCCPKAGEELTISYGDKGNEELLLLYGFVQPQNPSESLMLLCPVPPPDTWDEVFMTRMHLLQARGLLPQLFLTASHFEAATGKPLAAAPAAPPPSTEDTSSIASNTNSSSTSSSTRRPLGRPGLSIVPPSAQKVLEVFVMDKKELVEAAEQAVDPQQQSPPRDSGNSSGSSNVQQEMQQLGLTMAILTTFVRLLELKLIAMEGDEGTGPLESDLAQLERSAAVAEAPARQKQGQEDTSSQDSRGWSSLDQGPMPAWLRHCLVYRAGQKALVRGYLTEARAELQDTLVRLQVLLEASGELNE